MSLDPITVPCPECGHMLSVTIAEISRQVTKRCPGGHDVKIVDEGGGARQVQKSLDDLDRAIKRLGR